MSARASALVAIAALVAVSGCAFGEPRPTTNATLTGATLHGNIYSNVDGTTEYWWRYGGTPAYGSETPKRSIVIHDDDPHPVSEPLSGLTPNTTYHFRLCARDGEESPPRTNCSQDQTFSTSSAIGSSRIAFTSFRDGNYEIYAMNPDGGTPTRLTEDSETDLEPDWSGDGTKIAFGSDRDGNSEVYSMDADGGARDASHDQLP